MGRGNGIFTDEALKNEIEELEQTIGELRRSEASFRAIVENTPDQVLKYDRDLHRTYVNPAAAATYGLEVENLSGKPIGSVIADAHLDVSEAQISLVIQKIKSVFETGQSTEYKLEWPSPNGNRSYSVRLFPEVDGQSSIISVVGIARDITEHKRAADKVAKQKEILQKIFDHIPVMIRFADSEGNLILVNREWECWRGWTLQEISHEKIDLAEEGYPDPQYRAKVSELVANSDGKWVDFKTRVRDGRVREGSWFVIPLSDGTRIGIGQDVTERRKAERALQEARERLEMILDSMTDNFFAFDRDWRVTHFNQNGAEQLRLLGKQPESFIGKYVWEEFPNTAVEEIFRQAMQDRVVTTQEHYFPDLCEWIENRIYPSSDGGVAVFQRYITERKRAEEELRRSEAYLAEGQRLSHTGSWARNISTGEDFWSQELFRILGLDPAQTTTSYSLLLECIHPDDRVIVQHRIDSAVRERTKYEVNYRIVRPNGTTRHIHSLGHPVFDEDGALREYVGTVVDITVQQQADEERTQLLRRIITAQEEERHRIARELHDEMGQYLGALNLNLKSLLTAADLPSSLQPRIRGLQQLTKEFSQQIRRFSLELRPTVLDDLGLHTALTNHIDEWSKRNTIEVDFHSTGPVDKRLSLQTETALYRVLQEALNNVVKHSQAKVVTIILEYHRNSVVLIIEDDGVGFDLEAALSIAPQKRGLGLTSMRERVESVGGNLEIESIAGSGTLVVARVLTI